MTVLIETEIPKTGTLSLHVSLQAQINVSAEEARRKASRFVATTVSTNMGGREPMMLLSDRLYWRVPIHLTLSGFGDLGLLTYVDIDIDTGEFRTSHESITKEIHANAAYLAAHFAHPAAETV